MEEEEKERERDGHLHPYSSSLRGWGDDHPHWLIFLLKGWGDDHLPSEWQTKKEVNSSIKRKREGLPPPFSIFFLRGLERCIAILRSRFEKYTFSGLLLEAEISRGGRLPVPFKEE